MLISPKKIRVVDATSKTVALAAEDSEIVVADPEEVVVEQAVATVVLLTDPAVDLAQAPVVTAVVLAALVVVVVAVAIVEIAIAAHVSTARVKGRDTVAMSVTIVATSTRLPAQSQESRSALSLKAARWKPWQA
ncbi:MAG TPA: hypothetical protein VK956_02125 [Verrucomicrobium sp.]|nr:hypothetical protein [Verrucomicrobium sp.]